MTNYDKIFEKDINKNFFYNAPDYVGKKLVVGSINLSNAIERIKKDEYYTLVTYIDGEKLPDQYVPLDESLENGDLLATANPKLNFQDICRNGGIQRITKLSNGDEFLLGPGPDTFSLSALVKGQVNEFKESLNLEKETTEEVHRI